MFCSENWSDFCCCWLVSRLVFLPLFSKWPRFVVFSLSLSLSPPLLATLLNCLQKCKCSPRTESPPFCSVSHFFFVRFSVKLKRKFCNISIALKIVFWPALIKALSAHAQTYRRADNAPFWLRFLNVCLALLAKL